MTKIINGDLIMESDMTFEEDLKVEGNISGKNGTRYNLIVSGNLNCWDLNCGDLNCWDLNCWDLNCGNLNCGDLNCGNLNCWDLNCGDLNCGNLNCWDLNFFAVAIAYKSFKCKSWRARRGNHIIKCLGGEIEIINKPKVCDKCESVLK